MKAAMTDRKKTYRPSTPFYAYSSRNSGKVHPLVFRRKNQALTMWWERRTIDEIAASLDISPDTVRNYLKAGRRDGDARAASREDKRTMMAKVRRAHITELHRQGFSKQEIADRLNVHVRLVQIRLKECE